MDNPASPGRTEIPESELNEEQGPAATASQVAAASSPTPYQNDDERLDFFIHRDGQTYAGTHLIIDLVDAARLDDPQHIEQSLISAAEVAGATVLSSDFHIFTPNNGVSGVIVLAESHISIHTWPERGFAAVDVFMCGNAQPMKTIDCLKQAFQPRHIGLQEIKRGLQA
ncbi:MAG: adenosylmethionine decarboxylase [Pseudomonadota bacterium]